MSDDTNGEQLAELQQRAAGAGLRLYELASGGVLVVRVIGEPQTLPSLAAVARLLAGLSAGATA